MLIVLDTEMGFKLGSFLLLALLSFVRGETPAPEDITMPEVRIENGVIRGDVVL